MCRVSMGVSVKTEISDRIFATSPLSLNYLKRSVAGAVRSIDSTVVNKNTGRRKKAEYNSERMNDCVHVCVVYDCLFC